MLQWIVENRGILKLFYGLIIALICFIIVLRTDKVFRISLHKGIRYFRNAFLFFAIGFFIRFFLGSQFFNFQNGLNYFFVINILFEFFLVMGGFFLLYSLLWKKFEAPREHYKSSLLNLKIALFYIMALVIVFLDYIWQTRQFMFISQVILFAYASIVSYINCIKNSKHPHMNFYFVAMILSFFTWALNATTAFYFNWSQGMLTNIYIINLIVFLLFLYEVVKATK